MFRKPKSGYILGLLAALLIVAVQACNEQLPTALDMEPSVVSAPRAPSAIKTGDVRTTVRFCVQTAPISVDIGPEGDTIAICGNSLEVPSHSLTHLAHIVMLPVLGQPGAVEFLPQGLHFALDRKPTLTLSTDPVGNPATAYIVYEDDHGSVKEKKTE